MGVATKCYRMINNLSKLQGSCRSWKTWKVMEFYGFIFQAWQVMKYRCGPWMSWKMTLITEYKLNNLSSFFLWNKTSNWNQDNSLETFYENGQILVMENFDKSWPKRSWKVMEFQKPKRVRTLSYKSAILLIVFYPSFRAILCDSHYL